MNFFEYQDRARRSTAVLVGLYVLAVILTVLAVYAAVMLVFHEIGGEPGSGLARRLGAGSSGFWQPAWLLWTAIVTGLIVLGGTIYRVLELAGSGAVVARLLGGVPVSTAGLDPATQQLRNVVEEMAIASGTPVPEIFVLPEEGINAFAAGHTPQDAAVAVTRGALRALTRDELQGVVAHEFSHILNGDMRLNVRLLGVLHGLLMIALTGYGIVRVIGRARPSRGKGGGAIPLLLLFGLLVMAVGYIGVFFANLIKAAIGREREYLADAAAAQFTRNPLGLAGALKKIAALPGGGRVETPEAAQTSHFFIAEPGVTSWMSFMATHPPLFARIQRLDPSFDGDLEAVRRGLRATRVAVSEPPPVPAAWSAAAPPRRRVAAVGNLVDRVGSPGAGSVPYAAALLTSIPEICRRAASQTDGAEGVLFALLLSQRPEVRQAQMRRLAQSAPGNVYTRLSSLEAPCAAMPAEARLPLADLAVSALRELDRDEFRAFEANLQALVAADSDLDVFEFVLLHLVRRRLGRHFGTQPPPRERHASLEAVRPDVEALLATLAWTGSRDRDAIGAAFAAGWRALDEEPPSGASACRLPELVRHLERLAEAMPALKARVLEACAACVAADGRTTLREAETLRAVADALDCPVPPFEPETVAAAA
jgi:Zn-dependent protease with chaperone function